MSEVKVLLIKPPIHSITIDNPSLGLAYIASVLREHKYLPRIIDAPAEGFGMTDIIKKTFEFAPEYIGITATTPEFPNALKLSKRLKKRFPNIPIILGGAHVTAIPFVTMKHTCFDVAVIGEGEMTILELLPALCRRKKLRKIKGIVFRENGKIVVNPTRAFIEDIDSVPFPAFDLLPPLEKYKPSPGSYKNLPVGFIITGRGCPFKCTFCARNIFGNTVRLRSAKNIVDEMELLIKKFGVREIRVWDDTFNVKPERAIEICKEILKRKLKFSWTCLGRVNFADKKMLKLMIKAGCWQISYGVESGNQHVLNRIRKGITPKMVEDAVKLTKKIGIEVKCFFMIGLPGDTKESMQETIDFAKNLDPDIATFSITTPLPGTDIYKEAIVSGEFKNNVSYDNYLPYETKRLAYVTKGLTTKDVFYYRDKAYREFYLRPTVFWRELRKIKSYTLLKAKVRGFLSIQK